MQLKRADLAISLPARMPQKNLGPLARCGAAGAPFISRCLSMDWWLGALAFVLLAIAVPEVMHALDIIGDPLAGIAALFHQLLRLLPW